VAQPNIIIKPVEGLFPGLYFLANPLSLKGRRPGLDRPRYHGDLSLKQKSDYSLDLRNRIIPFALLNATEAFRQLKGGEIMEILVGDPDTKGDLLKVLPSSLYELVEIRTEESFFRIFLKKGRDY
jgi:TusA-related sulfurtransferase